MSLLGPIRPIFLMLLAVSSLYAAPSATYIPYDVADAVHELDKVIDVKARKQIALDPVGMIFRDRWRLWHEDSRLSQYFYHKGIYSADLMWGIIAEAYEARALGVKFDLGESLRRSLTTFPYKVNVPKALGNIPDAFREAKLSHDIQRDDLSVIHVFSSPKDGNPIATFIHGTGWQAADERTSELLKSRASILVPYNTDIPAFQKHGHPFTDVR